MTMKSVLAHSIKSVKEVNTKFGRKCVAEVEIQGQPKQEFWMSLKQGDKLSTCFDTLSKHGGYSSKQGECHLILEDTDKGQRFVWCGMHTAKKSDLAWLEKQYGVTIESPYIGRFDLEQQASPAEAHDSLQD